MGRIQDSARRIAGNMILDGGFSEDAAQVVELALDFEYLEGAFREMSYVMRALLDLVKLSEPFTAMTEWDIATTAVTGMDVDESTLDMAFEYAYDEDSF